MAKKSKTTSEIISIVFMVVGIGLLIWGYQMSGSIGSQVSKAFTGSVPEKVILMYIGGAASFILGLYLFLKR